MAKRRKYISVIQVMSALGAYDALIGLPGGAVNNAVNKYRNAVTQSLGMDPGGAVGAATMLFTGGIGSQLANEFLPGAKLGMGKWGVKL